MGTNEDQWAQGASVTDIKLWLFCLIFCSWEGILWRRHSRRCIWTWNVAKPYLCLNKDFMWSNLQGWLIHEARGIRLPQIRVWGKQNSEPIDHLAPA